MPTQQSSELTRFQKVCTSAAKIGADCLNRWLGKIQASEKAPNDLVTEADFQSQELIYKHLQQHFPDHRLLGEEQHAKNIDIDDLNACEYCWVIDPLDGTMNYVHGLNSFSVSIALVSYGVPLVATVIDPVVDECFEASKGGGAFCNGMPIQVSDCDLIENSLTIISLPSKVDRNSVAVKKMLELVVRCRSIRRLGSAALNLCYVAAGRCDAYWAETVNAWDVAAGNLIASEAGAFLADLKGKKIELRDPKFVVASTEALYKQIMNSFDSIVSNS